MTCYLFVFFLYQTDTDDVRTVEPSHGGVVALHELPRPVLPREFVPLFSLPQVHQIFEKFYLILYNPK